MSLRPRRAAAICLTESGAEALLDALAELGIESAGRATDGAEGLRLIEAAQPDLAVIDAVLPGGDGIGLAGRIRALRLNVQPGILLLRPEGLRLPGEAALPDLGAICVAASADTASLAEALERLLNMEPPLPPEKAARLDRLLDALGVPEHPGRDCLREAVALAWADRRRLGCMKDGLYPLLARRTGVEPARAERAMRHAIDVAWRKGEIEQQHRIFGDTIDARRGKPTCGEMIAQLADILRWEG